MPKLFGNGVRLRAAERADLPTFVRWFGDPEVTEYLNMHSIMSLASEEIWFEGMLKKPFSEQVLVIEVADCQDIPQPEWQPIGTISFNQVDTVNRNGELGIVIGEKAYWNRGFGSEAIRTLLDYGFFELNLHRIFLRVNASNQRGLKAYTKVGFIHEGTLREASFGKGHYQDVHIMSILRPEWDKLSKKKG
ncbi:MAG TPA: GNAT family protein [Anaerolineaceae bacterium]|nr:GNAT family protein [Anaerolineaceae bacterium]